MDRLLIVVFILEVFVILKILWEMNKRKRIPLGWIIVILALFLAIGIALGIYTVVPRLYEIRLGMQGSNSTNYTIGDSDNLVINIPSLVHNAKAPLP